MSEWNNIEGLEGWSAKLGELLAEARTAAQKNTLPPRLKINERLMQFVEHSWPNTPEIKELDRIAFETASALMRATIDERLAEISQRTGTYQQLAKQFRQRSIDNQDRADAIRLQGVVRLLDSATETVAAAKAVQESLANSEADPDLVQKIAATVKAIEELRARIGDGV